MSIHTDASGLAAVGSFLQEHQLWRTVLTSSISTKTLSPTELEVLAIVYAL